MNISITPELELRLRHAEDAQAIFELIDKNRAYLRRYLPWVDGVTVIEDTRKYIEVNVEAFTKKTAVDLGIWYEGKWVGSVGSTRLDLNNKKVEIGYWLDEGHSGKGIMTQSVKALIEYLFNTFDLNRIEIHVTPENIKSSAIPERLGFTYEGTLRQVEFVNGTFLDNKVYGLLREESGK